jgi:hyperosmotically inducible periplasmic protein
MSNHRLKSWFFVLPVALSSLLVPTSFAAQAPDNTAHNKQHDMTADQQSNSASDRATTQKIRKALMSDKSLSTYAHNVKVITTNGAVTLKGPVTSEDEKQKVASLASQIAGDKLDNQLTVKAQ